MSTEENKACQRRFVEEFINKGNTAVAEALLAETLSGLIHLGKSKGKRA